MLKITRALFACCAILFGVFSSNEAAAFSFDTLWGNCCDPCCKVCEPCAHEWTFKNDLLLWRADEDGLAYTTHPQDVLTTTDFTTSGKVNPHYEWNWGYRLTVGYIPEPTCSPWEFYLSWTSIENKAHGRRVHNPGAPDFEGTFPIWASDTLVGDYVGFASERWHVNTNIVDFDAAYKLCYWNRFVLTPQIGVRIAWLHQKLTAKYSGGTFLEADDENVLRNKFVGAGPRFGTGAKYYLCNGVSLTGFVAVATMWGHYKITHKEDFLGERRFQSSRKTNRFAAAFDYSVGLEWVGKFFSSCPDITLAASWEGHTFFDQNQLPRGHHGFFKRDRDLTLEGFTFSGSVAF